MAHAAIQTAIRLIYPPRCTLCGGLVDSDHGLCGPCWRDTPVISGLVCDTCGVPLPGTDAGTPEHCDDCLRVARPWDHGRAALLYRDNARRLVLALKHGDRHDIVRLATRWMAQAAGPLLAADTLIAPVPLHRLRLLSRRFNQSALLAQGLARVTGHAYCPDLLLRRKRTKTLDGLGFEARFSMLQDAITVHPRRATLLHNRPVLLVDDVMTSGATLSASAQACHAAGASGVAILTLARVAKDT
ncbi:ComF family protein [Roseovarius aestuariivivens]|uniref:ComF family protein n=1 Tax=Roseovarius aestuariivivens TaxID=1888910 RepID=UPI0010800D65|nr:ComF family protein [Roseovarius aestuariivivens]